MAIPKKYNDEEKQYIKKEETEEQNAEIVENKKNSADVPSTDISAKEASVELVKNLHLISQVFESIEEETAEIADMIFEYLVNVGDEHIAEGKIPSHGNEKINSYIKILNRLFLLSRKNGSFRIINRNTVEALDRKTFTISMCHDGGVSLDILCDIVNVENQARIPTKSPVQVTVKKMIHNEVAQTR